MPLIPLDHEDDPRVAEYRDVPDPALVRQRGLFVAEGHLVVRRLLESRRFRTRSVLLAEGAVERLRDVLEPRLDALDVFVMSRGDLSRVGGFNFHRGCLALGERPAPALTLDDLAKLAELANPANPANPVSPGNPAAPANSTGPEGPGNPASRRPALVLALEGIANADNVGSLFRNAAAFGARAILLDPRSCDPLYRKAIRTSMGAALTVPFFTAPTADAWQRALLWLREQQFALLALAPEREDPERDDLGRDDLGRDDPEREGPRREDTASRASEPIAPRNSTDTVHATAASSRGAVLDIEGAVSRWGGGRVALLAGSEGAGLEAATRALADASVSIRMAPGVDSLNVATATGIALHRFFDVASR